MTRYPRFSRWEDIQAATRPAAASVDFFAAVPEEACADVHGKLGSAFVACISDLPFTPAETRFLEEGPAEMYNMTKWVLQLRLIAACGSLMRMRAAATGEGYDWVLPSSATRLLWTQIR